MISTDETRWLEPRLAAEAAVRRLRGRRLGRSAAEPRSLELIWTPYRLITAPVTRASSPAASQSARADHPGTPRVACLVCCLSGAAARVRLEDQRFLDSKPDRATVFAERLSAEVALAAGRRFLGRLSLLGRGFGPAPLPEAARCEGVWWYPYWTATIERRRQRLDLRALDAASGQRTGAATRRSILQALLDEHRRARTQEPGDCRPETRVGGIPFG